MSKRAEFSDLMVAVESLKKSMVGFADLQVDAKVSKSGNDFKIDLNLDQGNCTFSLERKKSQVSIISNKINMDFPPEMDGDFKACLSMTIHIWFMYSYCLKKIGLRDLDVVEVLNRIDTKLFIHLHLTKPMIDGMELEKIIPDIRVTKIAVEGIRVLHPELLTSVKHFSPSKFF